MRGKKYEERGERQEKREGKGEDSAESEGEREKKGEEEEENRERAKRGDMKASCSLSSTSVPRQCPRPMAGPRNEQCTCGLARWNEDASGWHSSRTASM